jgi:radical SAM superfamily enzyme YgiQ (UPF0313 family)
VAQADFAHRVILVSVDYFKIPELASVCLRNWARRDKELDGVAIDFLRFPREDDPEAAALRILESRPALVGFTCYLWNIKMILDIARRVRRLSPSTAIVLGGAEVAPIPDRILGATAEVDFVALGEGEETFRLLLHAAVLRDRPLAQVPGLAFRENGAIVKTAVAPLIDLALVPAVYGGGDLTDHNALLEAARGCPFLCSFCDWGPRKMRYVPLARLEGEIRDLSDRYKLVILCDADLLMDKKHGLAVMEMFYAATKKKKGREFALQFDTNPVFLCDKVIEIMSRDPEIFHLGFGLQSTNEETLKRIHRPFDMKKAESNLRRLKLAVPQARIGFTAIYGLPGDDLNSFRATVDWILKWKPTSFGPNQLMVLPGADLIDESHPSKFKYQSEPPYQVYETDVMSAADMAKARELSYYGSVLFAFRLMAYQSAADILFSGERDPLTMKTGARVLLLEGWIEHLKNAGIDLTFGMPILETDAFVVKERFNMALHRLETDKLTAAAVVHATRQYSEHYSRALTSAA